jgi:hypothetical protein
LSWRDATVAHAAVSDRVQVMVKRKKASPPDSGQLRLFKQRNLTSEEAPAYIMNIEREVKQVEQASTGDIPHFTSTEPEIRKAVEQNAIDRGGLLIGVITSLNIEGMLDLVDKLAEESDKEEFAERADEIGIDLQALRVLDNAAPPIAYSYYFCLPENLRRHPQVTFYYRNVAMLSAKVMRGIGQDTKSFEEGSEAPSEERATALAQYFNEIVSDLVLKGGVTPYRHLTMMMANLGDSLGGTSRNEVGRIAVERLLDPVICALHKQGQLWEIEYSLKGKLLLEESEETTGEASRRVEKVHANTDLAWLLRHFQECRVLYHEIRLKNGNRLKLNRQLEWHSPSGDSHKIGPDLHTEVGEVDMLWAGEVKGGADPAGSDEHWKTATQTFDRILAATDATSRPRPMLSFIATILVERVAREAQAWIEEGKLTSVYNLTRIMEDDGEKNRFVVDMMKFLGCQAVKEEPF